MIARYALAGVLSTATGAALAQPPAISMEQQACLSALDAVQGQVRFPSQLLRTIASVESGRPDPITGRVAPWPWTINVEGTGYFFSSKAEAIEAVARFNAQGIRSIDVGCMQINLLHHPNAFRSMDEAFDPRVNVAYGARFLGALYHQTGGWPLAVAAYHSQTPALGAEYWGRVTARWSLGAQYASFGVQPGAGTLPRVPVDPNLTSEFARRLADADEDHQRLVSRNTPPAPLRRGQFMAQRQQGPARVSRFNG